MTFSPERIVRAHLQPISSYVHGSSPEPSASTVRLDWNESPFGLSPRAQEAYDQFNIGNRYPDFNQSRLISALASYVGVSPERIVAGAGLDDVFATTALTIIDVGDEVVISDPTFGVYRSLFELHGARVVNVPLGSAPNFALDVDGILAAITVHTKLIIICNPNNPTGTLFDQVEIETIVSAAPCLVAIDEAYAEFSGVSHLALADRYPNVILFRTMSKFAGLAGYRVGFGVFPPSLLQWVKRATPAFCNLSGISAAVAIASLQDLEHLMANVQTLLAERERLARGLGQMSGLRVFPSAANFLLVALPVEDSGEIVAALADNQVFVRRFADPALCLSNCVRVSVGSPRDNTIFLSCLSEILSRQPIA